MTLWEAFLPEQPRGLSSLLGHSVLVVGTGRESVALAHSLLAKGHTGWIGALDGAHGESLSSWVETFGDRIPVWVSPDSLDSLPTEVSVATIAVMSPGIPVTGRLHQKVSQLGIPVTSGTALFVADHHQDLLGVTGSKGKSTTSTLIHHLLDAQGLDVGLGGNMGIPVQSLEASERWVVELSSYQCRYLEVSPWVCVLTALFPEHLDWHGSQEDYYRDKLNVMAHSPEIVIANGDDETLRSEITKRFPMQQVIWVGEGEQWHLESDDSGSWLMRGEDRLLHSSEIALLGRHNHHNALIALAAATMWSGLQPEDLSAGLQSFQPLPNRLEKITDPSGLVFVNDTLATNPQAAAAALKALQGHDIALIIGGKDRGVDYQLLIDHITMHKPKVVLGLPESGKSLLDKCAESLQAQGVPDAVHLESVDSMEQAVRRARALMAPGSYVVLSPGAPSFGVYRDYQHRADDFRFWISHTIEDGQ